MAEASGNRKFDSLDFFLVVMGLLTVVALFVLFHSLGKMSDLQKASARADDQLAQIQLMVSAPTGPARSEEPINEQFFMDDIPNYLRGRAKPSGMQPGDVNERDNIVEKTWRVEWRDITRYDLALYLREAETRRPGLKGARFEMRNTDPPDAARERYRVTVTFTFYETLE